MAVLIITPDKGILISLRPVLFGDDALHTGHRKRLIKSYLDNGLDVLEDHRVLELLLFYCIPRKDTNEIAHRLIQKCGSLHGVLDADPRDLMKVEGVGENTAVFLSMMPRLMKRYQKSKQGHAPLILTPAQAAEYASTLFTSGSHEEFYIICLDSQSRVKAAVKICSGTVNELPVYTRVVVEAAIRSRAFAVILAHNHPGGSLEASVEDIEVTENIVTALNAINIAVRDHIIVTDNGCLSLAKRKVIEAGYTEEYLHVAAESPDTAPRSALD